MRIETAIERLFFSTVYVEALEGGRPVRVGTGFVYGVPTSDGGTFDAVVTNKHVIEDASHVRIRMVACADQWNSVPLLGRSVSIVLTAEDFVGHPDRDVDVAAAALGPALERLATTRDHAFYRPIPATIALDDKAIAELDAMVEVTFIGYPNGLYDRTNFLPILRRGVTASPLEVDYEGRPVFLIDGSVYPGSSGSPVLLIDNGWVPHRGGGERYGDRLVFLGVVAEVYQRNLTMLEAVSPERPLVRDVLDVGVVYKAPAVDATVDALLTAYALSRGDETQASGSTH